MGVGGGVLPLDGAEDVLQISLQVGVLDQLNPVRIVVDAVVGPRVFVGGWRHRAVGGRHGGGALPCARGPCPGVWGVAGRLSEPLGSLAD